MTDLTPTLSPMLPNEPSDVAGNPTQELSVELEPPVFATVSKTVLKLADVKLSDLVLVGQSSALHSLGMPSGIGQPMSEPIIEAMKGLVEIVDRLCSPNGGWPTDLEQTPENLAPYVTEEVYEVLHSLSLIRREGSAMVRQDYALPILGRYWSVERLIPRLLWSVARNSYDTMQLMGGVKARMSQRQGEWQPGILRLAPILEVQASTVGWELDLVTNNSPSQGLPGWSLVQSDDGSFCKQATQSQMLLEQLTRQIQTLTPEVELFSVGIPVDVLEPGQSWQSGRVRLRLDLVFMEEVPVPASPSNALVAVVSSSIEPLTPPALPIEQSTESTKSTESTESIDVPMTLDDFFTDEMPVEQPVEPIEVPTRPVEQPAEPVELPTTLGELFADEPSMEQPVESVEAPGTLDDFFADEMPVEQSAEPVELPTTLGELFADEPAIELESKPEPEVSSLPTIVDLVLDESSEQHPPLEADRTTVPTIAMLFLDESNPEPDSITSAGESDEVPATLGELFADDGSMEQPVEPDEVPVTTMVAEIDSMPSDVLAGVELPKPALDSDVESVALPEMGEAIVQLTDRAIADYYITTLIKQKLTDLVPQVGQIAPLQIEEEIPTELQSLTLPLVQMAFDIVSILHDQDDPSEHNFLKPEILIDEWLPKLVWHLTGSSYEVTQLLGGVRARVLQPDSDWQAGMLRLLTILHIRTPELEWQLDLGSGQLLSEQTSILGDDVIVQSDDSDLCQNPDRVETLITQLTQQVQASAPVIRILMEGVTTNLLELDEWRPGSMQLSLHLSLMPNVGIL